MSTFINKYWAQNRRRDYEATNICFAVAEQADAELDRPHNWQATTESVPAGMASLHVVGGVRYFGYL